MNAADIGARLREEVEAVGGQTVVANFLGVHRNTVYNWFTTAKVDAEQLVALAAKGVDVLYVLTGQRNVIDAQGQMLGIASRTVDRFANFVDSGAANRIRVVVAGREHVVDPDHYRWVPVLNVRVSGGPGGTAFGENIVAFNAYRREWLDKKGLHDAMLSEVTVTGESMSPELREGDTVLVNHSANELQGGAIYVIRQGEELLVKYLQLLPGGRIQVNSENSAAYPSYIIEPTDFESGECEIVGRVVRQGRDR